MPPGKGRQLSRWSFGSGHRTASATNETTSTIAAATPTNHPGVGRSERATSPCASWITPASRRLNDDLRHERVSAGVLRHVALQLEHALEIGREPEPCGRAGRRVHGDVVAVQVELIRSIARNDDP